MTRCLCCAVHNLNFFLRQPVQLVNQPVNFSIRRVNLTLVQVVVGLRLARGKALVEFQHLLDEFHHAVVAGNVGGVSVRNNDQMRTYSTIAPLVIIA